MQNRLTKYDIAIMALCLALALVLFALPLLSRHAGAEALIRDRAGNETRLSLSKDTILTVSGENGLTLTVTVEGGRIWVSESSCPDRLCVACGNISRAGETIVCLPAGIVITVQDGKAGDADAILG